LDFELNLNSETVDCCFSKQALCLASSVRVREALVEMRQRQRSAVLVCRDDVLVGIFTERDALHLMAEGADLSVPLADVMTPNPVTLHVSDTVAQAIAKMAAGGYRRLPVVDDHGRPVGAIRVGDVLHYLVAHFPKVIYNLPPEPHHCLNERDGA
jgi:CBS domain-containing protein